VGGIAKEGCYYCIHTCIPQHTKSLQQARWQRQHVTGVHSQLTVMEFRRDPQGEGAVKRQCLLLCPATLQSIVIGRCIRFVRKRPCQQWKHYQNSSGVVSMLDFYTTQLATISFFWNFHTIHSDNYQASRTIHKVRRIGNTIYRRCVFARETR
jgi:hypothetical protein